MGESRGAVVVVNWNGAELLPGCLSALRPDAARLHLIVVDNGSTDGSERAAEHEPGVELVRNPRNDGWARGNNLGIRKALQEGADWIALFNTDTRPAAGWPSRVEAAFAADPRLGAVGFSLFEGREESVDRAFRAAAERPPALQVREVDFVTGAALVLRAGAIRQVGLIDETYFLYCEDMDLCERLRRAGWKVGELTFPVRHFSEGTSRRIRRRASYLSMRNSLRFFLRYRGPLVALRHLWGMLLIASGALRLDDPDDIRHRYRPGPAWLNVALWLAALGWNVLHLPGTLWAPPRVTA